MKRLRLYILGLLAVFGGLSLFSYVSSLESGENAPFLLVLTVLSGAVTYGLAKWWDKQGKLPDEVTDRKNDMA